MTATLCLLGCLLAPAQAPPGAAWRGDWAVVPRLSKAQELVYRGAFTEEAAGGSVQFSRAFRIESRVFVLDTPPQGADVAFLTILKKRETPSGAPAVVGPPPAESVRLELARVDSQGGVTAGPGDVAHRAAGRAAHRGMRRLRDRAGRQGRRRFDLGGGGRGAAGPRLARRRRRHGGRRPLSETRRRAKVRGLGQAAGRPHRLAAHRPRLAGAAPRRRRPRAARHRTPGTGTRRPDL